MGDTNFKYHRDAVALLPELPQFSAEVAERLAQRERELGIIFPASVREWYSLDGAVDLLRQYSNDDDPVTINKLGEPFPNWYNGGRRDFVAQGLVVFMHENQGVCNWAFRLDGNADPEVIVEVDTAPNDEWLPCADKFSTFVHCQIWDHRHALIHEHSGVCGVSAQELDLAETDLEFLKATFPQRPSTCCWPGNANYRFEGEDGGILIWHGKSGADWFVAAKTPASLGILLSRVWHCGNLADTLYGFTPEAVEVLRELRGAGSDGQ
jgi:hypothetical protein